ncbi:unnamed protein product [Orchesella dallaii]|uniref:Uncharacterized protein n=1 Tax=Orchesella dallaii TaxID=48710 RepID=A0ABP1Q0A3_9HEXA
MQKSLLLLFIATYVAMCCARSAKSKPLSVFHVSDEDLSKNLIDEKHAALMTNEVQVAAPLVKPEEMKQLTESEEVKEDVGEEEVDDSESIEYVNDQAVENVAPSSKFINLEKPPSSPLEYVLDLLYGFCSWVYAKLFA